MSDRAWWDAAAVGRPGARRGRGTVFCTQHVLADLALCILAIGAGSRLYLHYVRADGDRRQRIVWPLGLFFWGRHWTLGAWCEIREDYRSFRLDRFVSAEDIGPRPEVRGEAPSLEGFLRRVTGDDQASGTR
ncbi:MAG: WYL domain-containing protein [Deltaproteobacteria bacterium]|nr:WYL domain-containing protein [Deltaproteobacteria bacterium]MCB9787069.1 WYL domain-containing protein [Deltaproteobacteria bacterium]